MSTWPDTIPLVEDGVTSFSEEGVNPIIQALATRTTLLKELISIDGVLSGVTVTDIGFSDSCEKGMLVAFDTVTNTYIPASVAWKDDLYSNTLPSDSSYVIGVLISLVYTAVSKQGTILLSGVIKDTSIIDLLFSDLDKVPGKYFLAYEGKMQKTEEEITLPVYCGTLTATGSFILRPQVPDFRTHSHTKYILEGAWTEVGSGFVYTSKDATFNYILENSSGIALIYNGYNLTENLNFEVLEGVLTVYSTPKITSPEEVIVYTTQPYMGVVAGINALTTTSDSSLIKVTQVGQTAVIDLNIVEESSEGDGYCVSSISKSKVYKAPVIHSITPGAGLSIKETSSGKLTIDVTSRTKDFIPLNIANVNNVLVAEDTTNSRIYYKFPGGISASLLGSLVLPAKDTTTTGRISIWADSSVSNLTCNYSIQPPPTLDTNSIVSSHVDTLTSSTSSSSSNGLKLTQSSNLITISEGCSILNIKLTSTSSDNMILVYAIGFQLEDEE